MWRAIWNGPFYIGRLEQPVSVGDAIMKVLETLWRGVVILVCCISAGLALLFVLDARQKAATRKAIIGTAIQASADVEACGPQRPIKVIIANRGTKALRSVTYSIRLVDPRRGTDVAPSHFRSIYSPETIPAGFMRTDCKSPWLDDYGGEIAFSGLEPQMLVSAEVIYVSTAD